MSKRKLSRQQQWRVEKIQAERAQRAEKRDSKDAEKLSAGEYGPEQRVGDGPLWPYAGSA